MKSRQLMVLGLIVLVVFSGCASDTGGGITERETGALLGSGLGAGLGAIIGNQTGHAGAGTAIGAASGLLAGGLLGESQRRAKANTQQQIREELMAQQYQQNQYAPQPVSQQTQYQQSSTVVKQDLHTKYNPRTGQTFPDSMKFDPNTGEQLQYLN